MIKKNILFLAFLLFSIQTQSQFKFFGADEKKMTVRFKLINNLIVLPLEVNGKPLSFILDTGVGKTLLFNLSENDSIDLKDVNKITLKGLGDGEPLEALLSRNNTIKIKNYISNKENIYVILKDKFDVSGKMGVTVHGIIGYKILRDVIVYINYKTKRITFYNPKFFKYKKCRRCEVFPLQFYGNKPYINAQVQLDTVGNKQTDVKLLIDSGGSSAIWLFEDTNEEIKTPKKYFKAILGEGLSGTIHGNNSRIKSLTLGRYKIKNPTVSFLDSASTYYARQFKERNGSIGGNILKRFKVWLDYPNGKITLRKNGSFRGGFEYNMSGIDVVYNGKVLVKEKEVKSSGVGQYNLNPESNDINTISLYVNYRYRFKPSYKIKYILPDSPADKAGLKAGDVIISINGVKVHKYSLKELLSKFQSGHRRKIRMKIERKDVQMKFEFRLKKRV